MLALLGIGFDIDIEHTANALTIEQGGQRHDLMFVFDGSHSVQHAADRFGASFVASGHVHVGAIEVTNLLSIGASGGLFVSGRFFDDPAHGGERVVIENREGAEVRFVRRYLRVLQPAIVDVLVEVLAGLDRLADIALVDTRLERLGRAQRTGESERRNEQGSA